MVKKMYGSCNNLLQRQGEQKKQDLALNAHTNFGSMKEEHIYYLIILSLFIRLIVA